MRTLRQSRTTLIVAHRLSTIADADVIVVMRLGCVAETGTHTELLQVREFVGRGGAAVSPGLGTVRLLGEMAVSMAGRRGRSFLPVMCGLCMNIRHCMNIRPQSIPPLCRLRAGCTPRCGPSSRRAVPEPLPPRQRRAVTATCCWVMARLRVLSEGLLKTASPAAAGALSEGLYKTASPAAAAGAVVTAHHHHHH